MSEWLYSIWGQRYCSFLYAQRYKPRRRKKKSKTTLIPNRVGIAKRPEEANLKLKYGHLEGDTIVSGRKTGSKQALSVIYDRKTQYTLAKKINSLKPKENNAAIIEIANKLKVFKTLTLDNGLENIYHEKLQQELNIKIYFCNPYSSWQKGGVENANKLIRRYIPKGCDIGNYSQEYINRVCEILNNKPRKSLGYKTPLETMNNNLIKEGAENKSQPPVGGWLKTENLAKLIKKTPVGVALRG